MSFTIDDVMEIIQIVKDCKDTELYIDTGEIKLWLAKGEVGDSNRSPLGFSGPACINKAPEPEVAPAETVPEKTAEQPVAAAAPTPVEATAEETSDEGLVPVKASVASLFYRKPSPEEPPFVEVGDAVKEDTVVCLLEVMKCFRQVTADVQGIVEKICVESNSVVEQGTTLFLIRPN